MQDCIVRFGNALRLFNPIGAARSSDNVIAVWCVGPFQCVHPCVCCVAHHTRTPSYIKRLFRWRLYELVLFASVCMHLVFCRVFVLLLFVDGCVVVRQVAIYCCVQCSNSCNFARHFLVSAIVVVL